MSAVLTCQHHIQWVREVPGGLHQCILCTQVVTKKDVQPKLEELPEEFGRRWDAHEATRPPAAPPAAEAPAPSKPPTATPIPRAPVPSRVGPPAAGIPHDPASHP